MKKLKKVTSKKTETKKKKNENPRSKYEYVLLIACESALEENAMDAYGVKDLSVLVSLVVDLTQEFIHNSERHMVKALTKKEADKMGIYPDVTYWGQERPSSKA